MYAEVAPIMRLPYTFDVFDYSIPEAFASGISVGQIIEVTFRGRRVAGVVMRVKEKTELKRTLPIRRPLSAVAALSAEQLTLAEYIAREYFASPSTVFNSFLPHAAVRSLQALPSVLARPKRKGEQALPLVIRGAAEQVAEHLDGKINKQGQTLLLIPEAWQEAEWRKFIAVFSHATRIQATQKPAEFFAAWSAIATGRARLILGTRSALFAPFSDLRTIIVADEGNENYKQIEPSPRYQARDVAWRAAHIYGARLILSSLAPGMETLARARHGEAEYLDLGKGKPVAERCRIVDALAERRKSGRWQPVSDTALEIISKHAAAGKVFVFLNKLGFAKTFLCRDCRYIFTCSVCHAALTYRKNPNGLFCFHCQSSFSVPLSCPQCSGTGLYYGATGVERLEEELAHSLRGLPIIRVDSFSAASPEFMRAKIQEARVVVGTKRAFALVPWNAISATVVIGMDSVLRVPEFRAHERAFSTLAFLASKSPELVIETSLADHSVFQSLVNPYEFFADREFGERKAWGYPPFTRLVKIIVQDRERENAWKGAADLVKKLEQSGVGAVLPPVPQSPEYQWGVYRFGVVVRLAEGVSPEQLHLREHVPDAWLIDIDPESLA